MTSSPPARPFDWSNLRLRIASGLILAPVAVLAIASGGPLFLILLAVAAALLALEWGWMSAPVAGARTAALIATAVLCALFAAYSGWWRLGWILLPAGALVAAGLARALGWAPRATDVAFGVVYIGAPCLCLLWLRTGASGLAWTLLLLAVAWAADIAAFGVGSALKGPKLWPRFSPNKTWSGFLAGLAAGLVAAVIVTAVLASRGAPSVGRGVLIGGVTALATMAGDLWESMLKRRFGVKDSGDLIPGHGGLLDRVDGLMFATLAVAGARLLAEYGA